MKKIIAIIFAFICINAFSQVLHPSYGEYFRQEMIAFDGAINIGSSFSCRTANVGEDGNIISGTEKIKPTACVGCEITAMGAFFGFTAISDGNGNGNGGGNKPVHVDSYTRNQNGKLVNVKSHYRSKPGHGGSSGSGSLSLTEIYFGYWLPCFRIKNFKVYSAPIIGLGNINTQVNFEDVQNDFFINGLSHVSYNNATPKQGFIETRETIYGAALKFTFNIFSVSIKATTTSATFGISATLPKIF